MMRVFLLPLLLGNVAVAQWVDLDLEFDLGDELSEYKHPSPDSPDSPDSPSSEDPPAPAPPPPLPPLVQQFPGPIGLDPGFLRTNFRLEFECDVPGGNTEIPGLGETEIFGCANLCGPFKNVRVDKSLQEEGSLYTKQFWQYNAAALLRPRGVRSCDLVANGPRVDADGSIEDLCDDIIEFCGPWCEFGADIENDLLGADGSDLDCYCNVLDGLLAENYRVGPCTGNVFGKYSMTFSRVREIPLVGSPNNNWTVDVDVVSSLDQYAIETYEQVLNYKEGNTTLFNANFKNTFPEGTKVNSFVNDVVFGTVAAESCEYSINGEIECDCVPETTESCKSNANFTCIINSDVILFSSCSGNLTEFATGIVNALAKSPTPMPVTLPPITLPPVIAPTTMSPATPNPGPVTPAPVITPPPVITPTTPSPVVPPTVGNTTPPVPVLPTPGLYDITIFGSLELTFFPNTERDLTQEEYEELRLLLDQFYNVEFFGDPSFNFALFGLSTVFESMQFILGGGGMPHIVINLSTTFQFFQIEALPPINPGDVLAKMQDDLDYFNFLVEYLSQPPVNQLDLVSFAEFIGVPPS